MAAPEPTNVVTISEESDNVSNSENNLQNRAVTPVKYIKQIKIGNVLYSLAADASLDWITF